MSDDLRQLKHIDFNFTIEQIDKTFNWTEQLACDPEDSVQGAFKYGYTTYHVKHTVSEYFDLSDRYAQEFSSVLEQFPNREWCRARFEILKPATLLKHHLDSTSLETYIKYWTDKRRDCLIDSNSDRFRQSTVYCQDHKPGHFTCILDNMIYDWRMGDYCDYSDVSHASGNFGTEKYYVMLVDYTV